MPYVPPHRRVGSGAIAEGPPGNVSNRSTAQGTTQHGLRAGGWGSGRARREEHQQQYIAIHNAKDVAMKLLLDEGVDRSARGCSWFVFGTYEGRSYSHLSDKKLYVLQEVEGDGSTSGARCGRMIQEEERADGASVAALTREEGSDERDGDDDTFSVASTGGRATADSASDIGVTLRWGASLSEAMRETLESALASLHASLSALAASSLRHSSFDRAKLVVRLGRVLFTTSPRNCTDPEQQPPFQREQFEKQMNREAKALSTEMQRHLETRIPEDVFWEIERMVTDATISRRNKDRVDIRVDDTDQPAVTYKLLCTVEGDKLKLRKIKSVPIRHAVVDVLRPSRQLDFRLMLYRETRHTRVTAEAEAAFDRILSTATVDPTAIGGVHWPLGVESGAVTSGGRFAVRSVRQGSCVTALSLDMFWKLRRVNGAEVRDSPSGRLTNEIEFCPASWRRQLRQAPQDRGADPKEAELQAAAQEAPQWTPASLLEGLPQLLEWIRAYLR